MPADGGKTRPTSTTSLICSTTAMIGNGENGQPVYRQFALTTKKPANSESSSTPDTEQASQQSVDARGMTTWAQKSPVSELPKAQTKVAVIQYHQIDAHERQESQDRRSSIADDESLRGLHTHEWSGVETDKKSWTHESWGSSNRPRTPRNQGRNGGFIRSLKRMYGKEAYDDRFAQLWAEERQDSFEYPTRWKRVMLLVSAILPYMIVSYNQNCLGVESYLLTYSPFRAVWTIQSSVRKKFMTCTNHGSELR